MKTILLTGASGFVGTNFILETHKKFNIIALVRKNSDISLIKNKCEIIRHSDNFQALNHIFTTHRIDGIIHLATKWTSNHTLNDIKTIIDTNILFGTQILEATKTHSIPFFINASSFGMFCNSNSYRPATLYAASKRAFEDIMRYYSLVAKSTIFCNLLIFNTFGLHDKTTRLFNLLDNIALNGGELDMSDGMQIVDYTHIKNVVWGFECLLDLIAQRPKFCKNKLFTLQSENRQTLCELVELYEKLLCKKLQINWGKRAKRELEITKPFSAGIKLPNWSEKVSLEDGLKDLISANKNLQKFPESSGKIADFAICDFENPRNPKNPNWGGVERDESRIIIAIFAESTLDSATYLKNTKYSPEPSKAIA